MPYGAMLVSVAIISDTPFVFRYRFKEADEVGNVVIDFCFHMVLSGWGGEVETTLGAK